MAFGAKYSTNGTQNLRKQALLAHKTSMAGRREPARLD